MCVCLFRNDIKITLGSSSINEWNKGSEAFTIMVAVENVKDHDVKLHEYKDKSFNTTEFRILL